MKTITETLPCELTTRELNELGRELSTAQLEYDDKEDEKKAVAKEWTEKLAGIHTRMRSLSRTIRAGSEQRPVDCRVEFHRPEPFLKRTIRLDTGEILRDEPMTAAERQSNLFEDITELNRLYTDTKGADEGDAE